MPQAPAVTWEQQKYITQKRGHISRVEPPGNCAVGPYKHNYFTWAYWGARKRKGKGWEAKSLALWKAYSRSSKKLGHFQAVHEKTRL